MSNFAFFKQLFMWLFILLVAIEILAYTTIRQHFPSRTDIKYFFAVSLNAIVSIWLWILWFRIQSYNGFFDQPDHNWMILNFQGLLSGVVLPRTILIAFHYTGVLIRRRSGGGHIRFLTSTGIIISSLIFLTIAYGTFFGRFDFKTEYYEVEIKGMKKDLNGFRIVQISDIHLPSFYHHTDRLTEVMDEINRLQPDLLVNTGDFITIGWREFGRADTILSTTKARYGEYAILGNHDFGTYNPDFTTAELDLNVNLMKRFISESGYKLLVDEFTMITARESQIAIIGLTTMGSIPDIKHGDLNKATHGIYGADLKILLAHDPNQWEKDVVGKTDIDITFSGHTHGMQIGIITKRIRWSPAKFYYPRWGGLYSEEDQYLLVNRGLGMIGMPFRIWMPPEISVITLKSDLK